MLGLRFVRGLSLVVASGGHSSSRCAGLTIAAPPVVGHRLQTQRLSSCGSRAQLLRGMWDLPRPGLEPVSPALAGGFSTTAPPGKPCRCILDAFVERDELHVLLLLLHLGQEDNLLISKLHFLHGTYLLRLVRFQFH